MIMMSRMEARSTEIHCNSYRIRLSDVWTRFAEGIASRFIPVGAMSSRKCAGRDPDRTRFQLCGKTTDRDHKCFNGGGRPVLSAYLTDCKEVLKDGSTINSILCRTCYDRCERRLAKHHPATPPTPAAASPVRSIVIVQSLVH